MSAMERLLGLISFRLLMQHLPRLSARISVSSCLEKTSRSGAYSAVR